MIKVSLSIERLLCLNFGFTHQLFYKGSRSLDG
jgi:hypothetical protein